MRISTLQRFAIVVLLGLATSVAHAESDNGDQHDDHGHEERAEHFEGKSADTLKEAVANFREANSELSEILDQDQLSGSDMTRIHKLSYTMENALARMDKAMDTMAADLESLHLASERMDADNVQTKGEAYLEAAQTLTE